MPFAGLQIQVEEPYPAIAGVNNYIIDWVLNDNIAKKTSLLQNKNRESFTKESS